MVREDRFGDGDDQRREGSQVSDEQPEADEEPFRGVDREREHRAGNRRDAPTAMSRRRMGRREFSSIYR